MRRQNLNYDFEARPDRSTNATGADAQEGVVRTEI